MTEIKIPQMRTIKQAAAECSIPEHFLRQLVKQNKVVYVRAGTKALVNLESLAEFLRKGEQGA
ncbi:MAG: DNA-binding protein [Oscillospiraceae bacterium]